MSISRRSVILAAGGAGLALIGSGGYFAVTPHTRARTLALARYRGRAA